MSLTIEILNKLVALMNTEGTTYEIEYQDHNDGEREKGYYLHTDHADGGPTPPSQHSSKGQRNRWQAHLRGSYVGMSRIDVVFEIVRMLVEDNHQTNAVLLDERQKKAQMGKALDWLQKFYDNGPYEGFEVIWIINDIFPYKGGKGNLYEHQYRDAGIEPYKQYHNYMEALKQVQEMNAKQGHEYYRVVRYFEVPEEEKIES